MRMRGNNGKGKIEQREYFWESFSDSYKTEVAEKGSEWEEELLYLEKLMVEGNKKANEDEAANHEDVCFSDLIQL